MLTIYIPRGEAYDKHTEQFYRIERDTTLTLEHSLVSIHKWEAKWKKPFLKTAEKTPEEEMDYIRCMTVTPNIDPAVYYFITNKTLIDIRNYINDPMTATTFSNQKKTTDREIVTAELIYHWMISLQIPFECRKWHLNQLLTLINVCSLKNQPAKKMSPKEIMERNRALNASRKAALNTRG